MRTAILILALGAVCVLGAVVGCGNEPAAPEHVKGEILNTPLGMLDAPGMSAAKTDTDSFNMDISYVDSNDYWFITLTWELKEASNDAFGMNLPVFIDTSKVEVDDYYGWHDREWGNGYYCERGDGDQPQNWTCATKYHDGTYAQSDYKGIIVAFRYTMLHSYGDQIWECDGRNNQIEHAYYWSKNQVTIGDNPANWFNWVKIDRDDIDQFGDACTKVVNDDPPMGTQLPFKLYKQDSFYTTSIGVPWCDWE
jgi:hypothetical protein